MNARSRPLEFHWDSVPRAAEPRRTAAKPSLSSRAAQDRMPADGSQDQPSIRSRPRAPDPAQPRGGKPPLTLDQWLTNITEQRTNRLAGRKQTRAATIKELEAALARVHGKRAPDEPETAEEPRVEVTIRPEDEALPVAAAAGLTIAAGPPQNEPAPDQFVKIARAMNMIAEWMDHVDERSVDTSRLVLKQQERTTRVLVSAVTSVSKRLTEMSQRIKALEDSLALTSSAETDAERVA